MKRYVVDMLKKCLAALPLVKIVLLLSCAWFAFLKLVKGPPMADQSVLIMIWASVLILLIVFFPKTLDKLKRIKYKDFEIELRDSMTELSSRNYIIGMDIPNFISGQKGSFRDLARLIKYANQNPQRPVLLAVNIKNENYISVSMLYMYLFFLEMFSSVIVLFVSHGQSIRDLKHLKENQVIGALSGKKAMQVLYNNFPYLKGMNFRFSTEYSRGIEHIQDSDFNEIYYSLRSGDNETTLSKDMTNDLFGDKLSSVKIDKTMSSEDVDKIYNALMRGEEYVLSFDNKQFNYLVTVNSISRSIAKQYLQNIVDEK